jgi:hypothetical protein
MQEKNEMSQILSAEMRKARKIGYNTFTELKQIEFQNKHRNGYEKWGHKSHEHNK